MLEADQKGKAQRRRLDPDRTRQEILAAAAQEFAEHGLSGARVEAIAARTLTVKRMIYYYFGSKEGLFLAVLEAAYADIRRLECELDLDGYGPLDAVRRLIAFTFDYEEAHPEFIRLVAIENIHRGRHLAQSSTIAELNRGAITLLQRVLDRGKKEGLFVKTASPVDIHLLISSFCFFRVSNRHTFGSLFGLDLSDPALRERHKQMLIDAVLNALLVSGRKGVEYGTPIKAA